jgi:osmotically-inducible protein OsmY
MLLPAVLAFAGAAVPAVPLAQEKSGQVVVEERRLPSDELIQAEVVQRLAANLRLEGRIGVESRNAVVTLSGWTRTSGQAWIAEEEARRVAGVAFVRNEIRPRMSA